MKILFKRDGTPINSDLIERSVANFGSSYNETVRKVIENSSGRLDKKVFCKNVAILMPNFKMTRAGPFKGVMFSLGRIKDPNGRVAACWRAVGHDAVQLRGFIDGNNKASRARAMVEISDEAQKQVALELWKMFKGLVSICMGKNTLGLVAASKVLFAVLPEVALPIDNTQWRTVFKTIDYGDIVLRMSEEMTKWEQEAGAPLDLCDPQRAVTLPAIYNVMAMKARSK